MALDDRGKRARHGGNALCHVDVPQAVWTQERDVVGVRVGNQLLLHAPALSAQLAEPGSDEDGVADAHLVHILEDGEDSGRWHDDEGEIDRLANIGQAGVRWQAVNGPSARVHVVDRPCKMPIMQDIMKVPGPGGFL
jgi:hypothetical protein